MKYLMQLSSLLFASFFTYKCKNRLVCLWLCAVYVSNELVLNALLTRGEGMTPIQPLALRASRERDWHEQSLFLYMYHFSDLAINRAFIIRDRVIVFVVIETDTVTADRVHINQDIFRSFHSAHSCPEVHSVKMTMLPVESKYRMVGLFQCVNDTSKDRIFCDKRPDSVS